MKHKNIFTEKRLVYFADGEVPRFSEPELADVKKTVQGDEKEEVNFKDLVGGVNQEIDKHADELATLPSNYNAKFHDEIKAYLERSAGPSYNRDGVKGLNKNEFEAYKTAAHAQVQKMMETWAPTKEELEEKKQKDAQEKEATKGAEKFLELKEKAEVTSGNPGPIEDFEVLRTKFDLYDRANVELQQTAQKSFQEAQVFQTLYAEFKKARHGAEAYKEFTAYLYPKEDEQRNFLITRLAAVKEKLAADKAEYLKEKENLLEYGKKLSEASKVMKQKKLDEKKEVLAHLHDKGKEADEKRAERKKKYDEMSQQRDQLLAQRTELDTYATNLKTTRAKEQEKKTFLGQGGTDKLTQFKQTTDASLATITKVLEHRENLSPEQQKKLEETKKQLEARSKAAGLGLAKMGETAKETDENIAGLDEGDRKIAHETVDIDSHLQQQVVPMLGVLQESSKALDLEKNKFSEKEVEIEKYYDDVVFKHLNEADALVDTAILRNNVVNLKTEMNYDTLVKNLDSLHLDAPHGVTGLLEVGLGTGLRLEGAAFREVGDMVSEFGKYGGESGKWMSDLLSGKIDNVEIGLPNFSLLLPDFLKSRFPNLGNINYDLTKRFPILGGKLSVTDFIRWQNKFPPMVFVHHLMGEGFGVLTGLGFGSAEMVGGLFSLAGNLMMEPVDTFKGLGAIVGYDMNTGTWTWANAKHTLKEMLKEMVSYDLLKQGYYGVALGKALPNIVLTIESLGTAPGANLARQAANVAKIEAAGARAASAAARAALGQGAKEVGIFARAAGESAALLHGGKEAAIFVGKRGVQAVKSVPGAKTLGRAGAAAGEKYAARAAGSSRLVAAAEGGLQAAKVVGTGGKEAVKSVISVAQKGLSKSYNAVKSVTWAGTKEAVRGAARTTVATLESITGGTRFASHRVNRLAQKQSALMKKLEKTAGKFKEFEDELARIKATVKGEGLTPEEIDKFARAKLSVDPKFADIVEAGTQHEKLMQSLAKLQEKMNEEILKDVEKANQAKAAQLLKDRADLQKKIIDSRRHFDAMMESPEGRRAYRTNQAKAQPGLEYIEQRVQLQKLNQELSDLTQGKNILKPEAGDDVLRGHRRPSGGRQRAAGEKPRQRSGGQTEAAKSKTVAPKEPFRMKKPEPRGSIAAEPAPTKVHAAEVPRLLPAAETKVAEAEVVAVHEVPAVERPYASTAANGDEAQVAALKREIERWDEVVGKKRAERVARGEPEFDPKDPTEAANNADLKKLKKALEDTQARIARREGRAPSDLPPAHDQAPLTGDAQTSFNKVYDKWVTKNPAVAEARAAAAKAAEAAYAHATEQVAGRGEKIEKAMAEFQDALKKKGYGRTEQEWKDMNKVIYRFSGEEQDIFFELRKQIYKIMEDQVAAEKIAAETKAAAETTAAKPAAHEAPAHGPKVQDSHGLKPLAKSYNPGEYKPSVLINDPEIAQQVPVHPDNAGQFSEPRGHMADSPQKGTPTSEPLRARADTPTDDIPVAKWDEIVADQKRRVEASGGAGKMPPEPVVDAAHTPTISTEVPVVVEAPEPVAAKTGPRKYTRAEGGGKRPQIKLQEPTPPRAGAVETPVDALQPHANWTRASANYDVVTAMMHSMDESIVRLAMEIDDKFSRKLTVAIDRGSLSEKQIAKLYDVQTKNAVAQARKIANAKGLGMDFQPIGARPVPGAKITKVKGGPLDMTVSPEKTPEIAEQQAAHELALKKAFEAEKAAQAQLAVKAETPAAVVAPSTVQPSAAEIPTVRPSVQKKPKASEPIVVKRKSSQKTRVSAEASLGRGVDTVDGVFAQTAESPAVALPEVVGDEVSAVTKTQSGTQPISSATQKAKSVPKMESAPQSVSKLTKGDQVAIDKLAEEIKDLQKQIAERRSASVARGEKDLSPTEFQQEAADLQDIKYYENVRAKKMEKIALRDHAISPPSEPSLPSAVTSDSGLASDSRMAARDFPLPEVGPSVQANLEARGPVNIALREEAACTDAMKRVWSGGPKVQKAMKEFQAALKKANGDRTLMRKAFSDHTKGLPEIYKNVFYEFQMDFQNIRVFENALYQDPLLQNPAIVQAQNAAFARANAAAVTPKAQEAMKIYQRVLRQADPAQVQATRLHYIKTLSPDEYGAFIQLDHDLGKIDLALIDQHMEGKAARQAAKAKVEKGNEVTMTMTQDAVTNTGPMEDTNIVRTGGDARPKIQIKEPTPPRNLDPLAARQEGPVVDLTAANPQFDPLAETAAIPSQLPKNAKELVIDPGVLSEPEPVAHSQSLTPPNGSDFVIPSKARPSVPTVDVLGDTVGDVARVGQSLPIPDRPLPAFALGDEAALAAPKGPRPKIRRLKKAIASDAAAADTAVTPVDETAATAEAPVVVAQQEMSAARMAMEATVDDFDALCKYLQDKNNPRAMRHHLRDAKVQFEQFLNTRPDAKALTTWKNTKLQGLDASQLRAFDYMEAHFNYDRTVPSTISNRVPINTFQNPAQDLQMRLAADQAAAHAKAAPKASPAVHTKPPAESVQKATKAMADARVGMEQNAQAFEKIGKALGEDPGSFQTFQLFEDRFRRALFTNDTKEMAKVKNLNPKWRAAFDYMESQFQYNRTVPSLTRGTSPNVVFGDAGFDAVMRNVADKAFAQVQDAPAHVREAMGAYQHAVRSGLPEDIAKWNETYHTLNSDGTQGPKYVSYRTWGGPFKQFEAAAKKVWKARVAGADADVVADMLDVTQPKLRIQKSSPQKAPVPSKNSLLGKVDQYAGAETAPKGTLDAAISAVRSKIESVIDSIFGKPVRKAKTQAAIPGRPASKPLDLREALRNPRAHPVATDLARNVAKTQAAKEMATAQAAMEATASEFERLQNYFKTIPPPQDIKILRWLKGGYERALLSRDAKAINAWKANIRQFAPDWKKAFDYMKNHFKYNRRVPSVGSGRIAVFAPENFAHDLLVRVASDEAMTALHGAPAQVREAMINFQEAVRSGRPEEMANWYQKYRTQKLTDGSGRLNPNYVEQKWRRPFDEFRQKFDNIKQEARNVAVNPDARVVHVDPVDPDTLPRVTAQSRDTLQSIDADARQIGIAAAKRTVAGSYDYNFVQKILNSGDDYLQRFAEFAEGNFRTDLETAQAKGPLTKEQIIDIYKECTKDVRAAAEGKGLRPDTAPPIGARGLAQEAQALSPAEVVAQSEAHAALVDRLSKEPAIAQRVESVLKNINGRLIAAGEEPITLADIHPSRLNLLLKTASKDLSTPTIYKILQRSYSELAGGGKKAVARAPRGAKADTLPPVNP